MCNFTRIGSSSLCGGRRSDMAKMIVEVGKVPLGCDPLELHQLKPGFKRVKVDLVLNPGAIEYSIVDVEQVGLLEEEK